jgi:uridine phosphorylase
MSSSSSSSSSTTTTTTTTTTTNVKIQNEYLKNDETDYLYHLGLDSSMDLKSMFSDVRFVCMGGSASRALKIAQRLCKELNVFEGLPAGLDVATIGKTERYSMYKVGPVVSVNHGMGMPSLSILLHETTKLLHYAGAKDVMFIRVGTSGGIGIEGGTVLLTTAALNGELDELFTLYVLGEKRQWPATIDADVVEEIRQVARAQCPSVKVVTGKTLGTDCFYEGQGRLDGAICEYTEHDKFAFLKRLHALGVCNIEMEASLFAAFTRRLGIRAALINVALLNRLHGDQVTSTSAQLSQFTDDAISIMIAYINSKLTNQG